MKDFKKVVQIRNTHGVPVARQGMVPRIHTPMGNMMTAATKARMAPKTTFSRATPPTGSGASSRSSISLL